MKETIAIVTAVAIIGVLIYLFVRFDRWRTKTKIEKIFAGRDKLDDKAFHEQYFANLGVSPEVSAGVRGTILEVLDVDLSRLSDTDDFSKNLRFFFDLDSLADVEIVTELEERFGIEISDQEAQATDTIRDIVLLVDKKVKGKAGALK